MWFKSGVLTALILNAVSSDLCPKQCDCDMVNGMNRATCVNQNIVNVDVGVPSAVQVYSLSHNVISELDNFCFKEAGYKNIKILNLSYNLIFWIGLHAFAELESLIHLDLSNNRIRFLPSDLLWDTPRLDSLDLSGNVFEALKNEPFLMHTQLQILNLNSCRIKSLPNRVFTRLPNLKKLDLSENYMVVLNTEVLRPIRKLERIELRNDYWQCNPDFIALESWISSRGISYNKQCIKKRLPNMSEKMVSLVKVEREQVDVSNVWNVTTSEILPKPPNEKPLSPLEKFDKKFPASQSFIIGIELGLAIGIIGTYIWLHCLCNCTRGCSRPRSRRERRRMQRLADNDMRTTLLWSTVINPDLDTPPLFRRVLPDRTAPLTDYGLPISSGTSIQADAIRMQDRAETPPPPYQECRINI